MNEKIVHSTNLVPSNECGFGQFARVVIWIGQDRIFSAKNCTLSCIFLFIFGVFLTFVTIFRKSATNTKTRLS
jgi:hypothetical protein